MANIYTTFGTAFQAENVDIADIVLIAANPRFPLTQSLVETVHGAPVMVDQTAASCAAQVNALSTGNPFMLQVTTAEYGAETYVMGMAVRQVVPAGFPGSTNAVIEFFTREGITANATTPAALTTALQGTDPVYSSSAAGAGDGVSGPTYIVGNALAGDTASEVDFLDPGDGTGIEAALAAAAAAGGGGLLHIRRGDYDLGSGAPTLPMVIPEGLLVQGEGSATFFTAQQGTRFQVGDARRVFTARATVKLRDLAFDVQALVGAASGAELVVFDAPGFSYGHVESVDVTLPTSPNNADTLTALYRTTGGGSLTFTNCGATAGLGNYANGANGGSALAFCDANNATGIGMFDCDVDGLDNILRDAEGATVQGGRFSCHLDGFTINANAPLVMSDARVSRDGANGGVGVTCGGNGNLLSNVRIGNGAAQWTTAFSGLAGATNSAFGTCDFTAVTNGILLDVAATFARIVGCRNTAATPINDPSATAVVAANT